MTPTTRTLASTLGTYALVDELTSTAPSECGCDTLTADTETLAEDDAAPAEAETGADADATDNLPATARWEGPLCFEGQATGDGRLIEPGALRWENLPIPLRHVTSDVGAHDGAVVTGAIDFIERRKGGVIWGAGPLYLDNPAGAEAYRDIKNGSANGVSVDLDDVSFEVRIAAELLEEGEDGPLLLMASDDEGERVTVAEINSDDELRVTTSARIRAATQVAIPAFAEARITLADESTEEPASDATDAISDPEPTPLVASSGPLTPPKAWFTDPELSGPSALTVTKEGRVYGHIALWDSCHTGMSHSGTCVRPPRSQSGYSSFHLGALLTAEGEEIAVGHLTLGTGHAETDPHKGPVTAAAALAHYDNTGTTVADVRAGEDQYGIWIAGAVDPTATPEQVRRLRSSPVSGDWRRVGTGLELVAALAVNMPGFSVPRPSGLVASGVMQAMVASGMLPPRKVRRPGTPGALSADDLRYLKRLAQRERAEEQKEHLDAATDLARRVRASRAEMKVRAFAASRHAKRTKKESTRGM